MWKPRQDAFVYAQISPLRDDGEIHKLSRTGMQVQTLPLWVSSGISQRLKRVPLGQSMLADHTDYTLDYRVQVQMLDLLFRLCLNKDQWLKNEI